MPASLAGLLVLALASPTVGDGSIELRLAIRERFGATEASVAWMCGRGVRDDELPVVYCIATRAKVDPKKVVALRCEGRSWLEVSLHFDLGADLFYVPFECEPGPPYGKAWGHFKHHPRDQWHRITLSDADVVELAGVAFLAQHHGVTPDEVVKCRRENESVVSVHLALKQNGPNRNPHGMKTSTGARGTGQDPAADKPAKDPSPQPASGKEKGPKKPAGKKGKG